MKTIVVQRRAAKATEQGGAVFEIPDDEVVDHIEDNPDNNWIYLYSYCILPVAGE